MDDTPNFSAEQHAAINAIFDWYNSWLGRKQTFTLGGLAGTGKSFLLSYIAKQIRGSRVCAPTGKAAYVQRENGVSDACTMHSLIYSAQDVNGKTVFTKRSAIDAELIIVDEAGMVGLKENNDLLSFNKPVLYFGDHGQLEPIGENPHILKNPDFALETIFRQKADSPILRLAMAFREGREKQVHDATREKGWYRDPTGRVTVCKKRDAFDLITPNTQVICGFNPTRHRLNQDIRKKRGFNKPHPMPGEPVICLSNQNKYEMFNGQIATVVGIQRIGRRTTDVWLGINNGEHLLATCLNEQFGKNTFSHHKDKTTLLLDWSYALTLHKTQGSGFDDVLVYEEVSERWDVRRWRYTGVTRGKEKVTYCW